MIAEVELAAWNTRLPRTWPEIPKLLTYSVNKAIETCPRRWALSSADYPELWSGFGYPPSPNRFAIAGTIVHAAIERVARALTRSCCTSATDSDAVAVLRELGGYTSIIEQLIDQAIDRQLNNPRALPGLENLKKVLVSEIPELRLRVQASLAGLKFPKSQSNSGGPRSPQKSRAPISFGTHPEIELRAAEIGWKGKADLLILDQELCELIDFKTGARSSDHDFQLRLYAYLWHADEEINPTGRLADKLTIRYADHQVAVEPLQAEELEEFAEGLKQLRTQAATLSMDAPPQARPSVDACRHCDVRHLCSAFWKSETNTLAATTDAPKIYGDFEILIRRQHGPKSWDATNLCNGRIPAGDHVLLRAARRIFREGQRIRLLNASYYVDDIEGQAVPVLSTGQFSETFVVIE